MSVGVYIQAVRDPDGKLKSMIDLALACRKNDCSYPKEVISYFAGTDALELRDVESMREAMLEVSLKYDLKIDGLCTGEPEYGNGIIIDLSKLPKEFTKLRIYMG